MHRAIETQYKGCRFRSRLEARYAVLFDNLKIAWDYEPEGFDLGNNTWYLPDFWLKVPDKPGWGYWVEVKALAPLDREVDVLRRLSRQTGHKAWFVVGTPGDGAAFACEDDTRDGDLLLSAPLIACSASPATSRQVDSAIAAARSARFGKAGRG